MTPEQTKEVEATIESLGKEHGFGMYPSEYQRQKLREKVLSFQLTDEQKEAQERFRRKDEGGK